MVNDPFELNFYFVDALSMLKSAADTRTFQSYLILQILQDYFN